MWEQAIRYLPRPCGPRPNGPIRPPDQHVLPRIYVFATADEEVVEPGLLVAVLHERKEMPRLVDRKPCRVAPRWLPGLQLRTTNHVRHRRELSRRRLILGQGLIKLTDGTGVVARVEENDRVAARS